MSDSLQSLCAQGQDALLATDYLTARDALLRAERIAVAEGDFETLGRLYMPLQEARRQIRQRAGEGTVKLDLIARPGESIDAADILARYPHGQLLVAGSGTIEPAKTLRTLAAAERRFVDVFLAAAYDVGGQVAVAIVPTADTALPPAGSYAIDQLHRLLPPHSILLPATELPAGEQKGTVQTFARTMAMFEQLAAPFLAAADAATDPALKIAGYRTTIAVDDAHELAHQRLSQTARDFARARRLPGRSVV